MLRNRRLGSYLLLLALLNACGDAPAQGGTTRTGEVSFMIFGDPAEKAAYDALVQAFKQRSPGITVSVIHIPGQTEYRQRLGNDFAAGTPADIVLINYRRYVAFAARDALEPLGSYLEQSTLIKAADFYPMALDPFRWQGQLMCIPQNLSSLAVYYNKAMFDQAGLPYPKNDWSWDDFLQTAQALTRDSNGDGAIDQHGLGTEAALFRVAPFIWQNGGDIVDNPAAPTQLALENPAATEAIRWFIELQTRHHVVPDKIAEAAEDYESRFIYGRIAMFLNSRRGVPTYREFATFDWDVAPLPRGKQAAGILHADAYCMPASSTQKEAAWDFIEFANSVEGQTIVAQTGRTVPSLKAVAESPAFLDITKKPANSRIFLETIPQIRTVPIMENWVDIETIVGEELERAFYGDISVDEAITIAKTRTQPFFAPPPP